MTPETESVIIMKKKIYAALLAASLLLNLWGCAPKQEYWDESEETAAATQETEPAPTVPADGNPEDVTCKGTYTADLSMEAVVATAGQAQLTNAQLQAWYWAVAAQYVRTQNTQTPDLTRPLDTQVCQVDASVNSWQQYFLELALQTWHSVQALTEQARITELPTEEAYQPNADTHARCMTGMPATKFLYGYDKTYETNTMHQAYLDAIPEMLEALALEHGFADVSALAREAFGTTPENLEAFAQQYNYAYMYLTFLGYGLEIPEEEVEAWYQQNLESYVSQGITRDSGSCVDIRNILLLPEGDWDACEEQANALLKRWEQKTWETEAEFAELAYRNSQDRGVYYGGKYSGLTREQLPATLADWCFAEERSHGDTAVLRSEQGVHILFFSQSRELWQVRAEKDLIQERYRQWIREAREKLPMEVDYSAICLTEAEALVSAGDILYPDIAHERYPEVPLYLQQDYPHTWYGNYKISSHGCGITTFSMLSTYMSDEEWTPPEMCDLYGKYSFSNGTDGMIFINESPKFGYFCQSRTYDPKVAKQAVMDGYIVVSIQHPGYWTRGGHYILLEKYMGDDMVQVRDSNIANYQKLPQHKVDQHAWFNTTYAGSGYWIFEKKNTHSDACLRCGTPEESLNALVQEGYLCEKCAGALTRRNAFLNYLGE